MKESESHLERFNVRVDRDGDGRLVLTAITEPSVSVSGTSFEELRKELISKIREGLASGGLRVIGRSHGQEEGRMSRFSMFSEDANKLPENYDGLGKCEIMGRLPSDSFALVDAVSDMPAGWPDRIRDIREVDMPRRGKTRCLTWWMLLDGKEWKRFYSYGLDVYLHEHKHEPAMIYLRRSMDHGMAYVPVMTILFDSSGHATKSSKKWCEVVGAEADRGQDAV